MKNSPNFAQSLAGAVVWCSLLLASRVTATPIPEPEPSQNCPVANPGGPYSGLVGVAVAFDGIESADPDGEPLAFVWDFDTSDGVGEDAVGPTPLHTYARPGSYAVQLAVSAGAAPESRCSSSATTTAEIGASCAATVKNGSDAIRLGSGGEDWFVCVQPTGGCYTSGDVVLSSIVLRHAGREIPASAVMTVVGDKDGDGIEEIRAGFSKENLKTLFAKSKLGNGRPLVRVTIAAGLVSGGVVEGSTQVELLRRGSIERATVAPNPFNPSTTLTFTTARAGAASVTMFDVSGRLVGTLLEERSLPPGTHEVRIEGRGERGEQLPSGIYFLRGVSAEGAFEKTITLLK